MFTLDIYFLSVVGEIVVRDSVTAAPITGVAVTASPTQLGDVGVVTNADRPSAVRKTVAMVQECLAHYFTTAAHSVTNLVVLIHHDISVAFLVGLAVLDLGT